MKNFTLKNGDTLSYSEFGDSSSTQVILYGHGFPGTGEEAGIAHRAALEGHFRIIAPTRPGIGHSTFDSHRTIMQWPAMVDELLQSLGVNRLSLLGVSGGTPYTLAFLHQFPHRVESCLIVSGMGPPSAVILDRSMSLFSRVPIWCAYNLPRLGHLVIWLIALVAKVSPATLLACYRLCMSADDRRLLRQQQNARNMIQNFQLALRQGARGVYRDFELLTSPWGFSLEELQGGPAFFHGDNDKLVPASVARHNQRTIKDSSLREFTGRGHFMAFEITREIVGYFNKTTANQL